MGDLTRVALNIEDLRRLSRRRLTKALFEFCDRGSEDEVQMRDNRNACFLPHRFRIWCGT